ncbi:DUF2934 domain-containing protein [Bradyrhizobium ottawaense]|uniref:DUF2934 domain-containing protein n=1 Tax=Bradyrhizobium ottawaense TaxID=931866 RepID=UPI003F9EF9D6
MNDDEIRTRAYRRWEREGKRDGSDQRHWYEAEDEIRRGKFLGLFEAWDIDALLDLKTKGLQRHPIAALAAEDRETVGLRHFPCRLMRPTPATPGPVLINTETAAKTLWQVNPDWIRRARKHLGGSDIANAAAALGELRAYSGLIEAFGQDAVAPGAPLQAGGPSPEFKICFGGSDVIVEVHSKQMDGGQQRDLAAFADAVADEVSRIAQIKDKEHQVDANLPFVLWLDLQDPNTWPFSTFDENTLPLMSGHHGSLESGAFWHAFYGRKGKPIISFDEFQCSSVPLGHEGRFFNPKMKHGGPSKVSAAILSFPRSTVVFEHPQAMVPLPPEFRTRLLHLPHFSIEKSYLEFSPGSVRNAIDNAQATIDSLGRLP